MKCLIFCLLAFCAFETVFADKADKFQQNLDKLHKKYVDEINKIASAVNAKVAAEDAIAKKNGINTGAEDDGCAGSSVISVKTYVDCRISFLDTCRDKCVNDKNIKIAKKCFTDTLAEFKKEAKIAATSAKKCIARCAHDNCGEDE